MQFGTKFLIFIKKNTEKIVHLYKIVIDLDGGWFYAISTE